MHYIFSLIRWAFKLHFLRASRYRLDTLIWTIAIWLTISTQAIFLWVTYQSSHGNFFGYTGMQVISFFGIALFANALAQSCTMGVTMHIARAVWRGEFDFWLLQPPPIALRMLTEELGFIWHWPQIIVGMGIMMFSLPFALWPLAFTVALLASLIEMGIVFLLGIPSIKWGKWDPYEGVWEYMQTARSIPIGQTHNIMLWIASFGVLQYSLALEVLTFHLSLFILLGCALAVWCITLSLLTILVRSYRSASS